MHRGGRGVLAVGQEFGESEDADDDGDETDAVQEPVHAEREPRGTGDGVDADHGDQQAEGAGDDRLDHGFAGERDEEGYADDHQGEELRWSDEQAQFPEGLGGRDQAEGGYCSADEGADGGDGQGRPGLADLRHRVAVDGGDRRGGFTGGVQQDAGDGSPVGGAVEDGTQHDDRAGGVQVQRQGDEQCDAGDRADSGQDADDGAEEAAQEGKEEVLPGHGGSEAAHKFVEDIHV